MTNEPVTIFKTFSIAEAELVCGRLEAAGFEASVTHELAALSIDGYSMSTGGVRVEVPADQAEEARTLLSASPPEAGESGEAGNSGSPSKDATS